jgi:hypothetical protein
MKPGNFKLRVNWMQLAQPPPHRRGVVRVDRQRHDFLPPQAPAHARGVHLVVVVRVPQLQVQPAPPREHLPRGVAALEDPRESRL